MGDESREKGAGEGEEGFGRGGRAWRSGRRSSCGKGYVGRYRRKAMESLHFQYVPFFYDKEQFS